MRLPAKKKVVKPKDAPIDQVKLAVKLLAKEMHSDVNGGNDEDMKEVTAAYNRIKQFSGNKTHIGFVLDDSGSMSGKREQVVASYNALLQNQASNRSQATFSISTFHDVGQITPIYQAPLLTQRMFSCGGNTPLYDTIADSIHRVDRELGSPTDVVIIIITDGQENCSREWKDPMRLAQLVGSKQDLGWQFIYCSSAWSARQDGLKIGIPEKCVTDFRDINLIFGTISRLLTSYRSGEIKQITFEGGV